MTHFLFCGFFLLFKRRFKAEDSVGMQPERAFLRGNIFQRGFKGSLIISIYRENKIEGPWKGPWGICMQERSRSTISQVNLWGDRLCVDTRGSCWCNGAAGRRQWSSVNAASAMSHRCSFQITSSLKYTPGYAWCWGMLHLLCQRSSSTVFMVIDIYICLSLFI